jgi:type I restriction enzyme S subunit
LSLEEIGPLTDGDWILNSDYSAAGIRLLQVGDIGKGRFIGKSSKFITQERARELRCTELSPRDVLISRMPDPIGRACLLPELGYKCITAVDVSIWRPNSQFADLSYLIQALSTEDWFRKVSAGASGATRPRISRKNLEKLTIPIPPLAEQKRIAAILNEQMGAIKKARAAAEAQLEAGKALPAAYLSQVFPKEGQELSPGWRWVTLGSVCDVVNGFGFPEHLQGRKDLPYPFIKVSDMNAPGAEVVVSSAVNTVDRGILDSLGARIYPSRTIIFPKVGGALLTNKKRLLGKDSCFDNNVMGLVPRDTDADFLFCWFQTVDLRTLCNIQALPSIKQSRIAALRFPMPAYIEQKRIAAVLNDQMASAERLRNDIEKQLHEINSLPAALLRRAFNGEI